ncbi:hypothetical protein [Clostridium sp. KNHs205]|uniref:hypothetical protein n=1 Tax=Clostridium sp. KNHs205 TaxID=1449050 RepID=UPI0018CC04E5|nr:hypothetical protein [Clostridium sp. KNHs205]
MKTSTKMKVALMACLVLVPLLMMAFYLKIKNGAEEQYTPEEFPISIELDKTDYRVGDTVSFTLTITNKCGKTVTLYSNGNMPCVDFQNIENRLTHVEPSALESQEFKKNEKISRNFNFVVEETGTYILDAHYNIAINNQGSTEGWFRDKLDDIEITVTP